MVYVNFTIHTVCVIPCDSYDMNLTLINISLVDPTWVFVVLSISKIVSVPMPCLICTRNEKSAPSKSKFLVGNRYL